MDEIFFVIELDEENCYIAKALGYPIFTQGETEEEIKNNIMDAVSCHFDKPPKLINLHFTRNEVLEYA
jgi:predicted RNase H-like HicB family nuclease